jgi:cytochrome b6-f complex iron-sulfur subunit
LWPSLRGGFGAIIDLGDEATVRQGIAEGGGRFEFPAGRMYVVGFDAGLPGAEEEYGEITNGAPFMALYQKCVHLGCRVPWCASSHWFECPCHGSRYNNWGEYRFGPAPRGLDRFALRIQDGKVMVDTSTVVTGPSRQTAILNQAPEGPHCN